MAGGSEGKVKITDDSKIVGWSTWKVKSAIGC